jgi:hypothetical protein
MTELLKKDKKFKWTPAYEASFQELKKQLTTALILVMLIWRSRSLSTAMRQDKD